MNKLEIKYNRAFCYKSLNKTRKSLDILQEIAKSSLYSVPKIANNDQISEMGVKTLKENLIENKNNEVLTFYHTFHQHQVFWQGVSSLCH